MRQPLLPNTTLADTDGLRRHPRKAGTPPRVGTGAERDSALYRERIPRTQCFASETSQFVPSPPLGLPSQTAGRRRPVYRLQAHCSSRERGHCETQSSCRTRECFRTLFPPTKGTSLRTRTELCGSSHLSLLAGKPVRATRPHTAVRDSVRFTLLLWRVISHPHM